MMICFNQTRSSFYRLIIFTSECFSSYTCQFSLKKNLLISKNTDLQVSHPNHSLFINTNDYYYFSKFSNHYFLLHLFLKYLIQHFIMTTCFLYQIGFVKIISIKKSSSMCFNDHSEFLQGSILKTIKAIKHCNLIEPVKKIVLQQRH